MNISNIVVRLGYHASESMNADSKGVSYKSGNKSQMTTFDLPQFSDTEAEEIQSTFFSLEIGRDSIDIPNGLTIVLGMTGAGKTRLLKDIGSALGADVHYFAEAIDDVDDLKTLIPSETEVMNLFARESIESASDATLFDSGRFLVFGRSLGGTGKGGIDKMLFPQLSALNNLYVASGKSLIMAMNPGDVSSEDYDTLIGNFASSVSVIYYDYGRYADGQETSTRSFSYAMRGPGVDRDSAKGTVSYSILSNGSTGDRWSHGDPGRTDLPSLSQDVGNVETDRLHNSSVSASLSTN